MAHSDQGKVAPRDWGPKPLSPPPCYPQRERVGTRATAPLLLWLLMPGPTGARGRAGATEAGRKAPVASAAESVAPPVALHPFSSLHLLTCRPPRPCPGVLSISAGPSRVPSPQPPEYMAVWLLVACPGPGTSCTAGQPDGPLGSPPANSHDSNSRPDM